MITWFSELNAPIQALIAGCFTFIITSLGAMVVLFFKKVNKNVMDASCGLAAGVMLAATFWSLLDPAIAMSYELKLIPWLVCTIGILLGCILLYLGDKIFDHFNKKKKNLKAKRCIMLVTSITLHNIPEGMAIGVAFGSIYYNIPGASLISAIILTIGIGIQNFPEGSAISLPLRRDKVSRFKAFIIGSLSGIVEPISAVIGAILVLKIRILLPILLSFAGGAMLYVCTQELIPESQKNSHKSLMTISTIIGFIIMMALDVSLG